MPKYSVRLISGDTITIEDDRSLKEMALAIGRTPHFSTKEAINGAERASRDREILIYGHAVASIAGAD